jgi:hypothetical protein
MKPTPQKVMKGTSIMMACRTRGCRTYHPGRCIFGPEIVFPLTFAKITLSPPSDAIKLITHRDHCLSIFLNMWCILLF